MIAFLRGRCWVGDGERLIVSPPSADIGYEVRIPYTHLSADELAKRVAEKGVYIWHVFRDPDQELFGFWGMIDRCLAIKIAETDGIGPVTASRLVQDGGCQAVLTAIAQGDAKLLAKLSKGFGPTRAAKVIHELKEYAEDQMQGSGMTADRIPNHRRKLIERSLAALGFTVNTQELTKILEDHMELGDSQIVRKYIDKVVVRTS